MALSLLSRAIPVYCIGPSSSSQLIGHEAISFTPTTINIPTYTQSTQVFNSDLSYGVQNLYILIAIWHYHLNVSNVWQLTPHIQNQYSWPNSLLVTAKTTIHSSTQGRNCRAIINIFHVSQLPYSIHSVPLISPSKSLLSASLKDVRFRNKMFQK